MIFNNKSVVENYFFMTVLQILNSFFYLLIYPYLIRVLGGEAYGSFVFATSVATNFIFFINFGFDLPATKAVAENVGKRQELAQILSSMFTAKSYLFVISSAVFIILLYSVPFLQKNKLLFFICYASIYATVLFPQFYFQGIQSMKEMTLVQLALKLCSLPLIFLFIDSAADLTLYGLIVTVTNLLGGVIAFGIIIFKHQLQITWQPVSGLKNWFRTARPFFMSSVAGTIKEYSIPIIIGSFFGMKEVAVYDLANKIVIVPRTIFMSINAAIFPKLIVNVREGLVKKIIRWELLLSLSVIVLIAVFGNEIVYILGGPEMHLSYFLAILLSVTIMSWLIVGAFINFVFIPNHRYNYVAINQTIAMISFFIFCIGGLLMYRHIMVFGFAMAFSGLLEILYCTYVTQKNRLVR